MTEFNDLPIELLYIIFSNLGIKDLIRARSVCKKFKFHCDKMKANELVIEFENFGSSTDRWYHTGERMDSANVIKLNGYDRSYLLFRTKLLQLNLLNELRRLAIFDVETVIFSHLFRFRKLEQLECALSYSMLARNLTISHDNIRILNIEYYHSNEDTIEITAEKLNILKLRGEIDHVTITWPENLTQLHAEIYGHKENGSKLRSFKNLEVLHSGTHLVDPILLRQLPKLKKFIFITSEDEGGLDEFLGERTQYYSLRQSVINLIGMKNALNRKELKIYFDDKELIDVKTARKILREHYSELLEELGVISNEEDSSDEDVIMIE